ncbi:MAG: flippase-like domain-containing protein [Flavobacteriales bacterium]|nr:flippase-like domain-containing protein [Flavobacteriales bacterium]
MKNIKLPSWLKWTIKLGITGLAIFIVYRNIDIVKISDLFAQSNAYLLALGLLVFALTKGVESLRLNVFFRAKGIQLSENTNFKLYLLGLYYNIFLPGGIGGDGYKVYWINKRINIPIKDIIWASIHNRISGLGAMFSLALLTLSFISFSVSLQHYIWLLIPVFYLAYFIGLRLFFKAFTASFIQGVLYSIAVQGMQLICAHLILLALGVETNFYDYWFLFLLSNIAFVIPVTVGGVGSRELVFALGAQYLAIDLNAVLALSLCFYVLRLTVSFVGIYYFLNPDGILLKDTKTSC